MTQYLISFGTHAMDHIPDEDMLAVAKAAHAVVQEAINAGVLVCTGGLEDQRRKPEPTIRAHGRLWSECGTCNARARVPHLAALLGVSPGAPPLCARAVTFDQSGRPIELSRGLFRGDRYRFRTTLFSSRVAGRAGLDEGRSDG